jgi:signal transduction histidine kinase
MSKRLRIIIIDDNPQDRLLAARELKQEFSDLDILEIGDAESFNRILDQDDFDLVITDYQLRWSNGIKVIHIIKSRYPDVPVIMFTGTGSEEIAVEAMKAGLDDYVIKSPAHFFRLRTSARVTLTKANAEAARKKAEQDRDRLLIQEQNLRKEAEEASRLKDEFLAIVSHELRTPLTSIIGWAAMLLNGNLDEITTRHGLETIRRNAQVQTQLIDDLLDVSRIITGKLHLNMRPVDLSEVIQRSLASIRPTAETKNININIVLNETPVPVNGDPDRLQQIMWNLLSNAIKFTPPGGSVEVRIECIDSKVRISVADTGQGIEPDFLPYVFDRFRQADSSHTRKYGGLGLGLAIVRYLVELHGGTVNVASEGKDRGATFTVDFPLASTSVKTQVDRKKQKTNILREIYNSQSLSGVSVLLVEDDLDTQELIRVLLENSGAHVRTATTVVDALKEFEIHPPNVIVSDIGLPKEDGIVLIQKIRSLSNEKGGRTPAIALTAYTREEDRMKILAAGYQMHVSKPVDPAELITVVANIAKQKRKNNQASTS